ncbi:hypothetical protein NC652_021609 [Populus alba x Populus x berolinensis]|uniref:Uncharacterized protein n=1 Tax=Populus alba x Populus x berolinensis TaxID=444605 RepID=A0AAD6MMS7_9ROSI|nr:hypothetical protein NC652_021609 [Populus alba x Populus x berolinensis]KAJ6988428.1 hypothetical protein NC653_021371 [Populus alba x Populus x berolinensis]
MVALENITFKSFFLAALPWNNVWYLVGGMQFVDSVFSLILYYYYS